MLLAEAADREKNVRNYDLVLRTRPDIAFVAPPEIFNVSYWNWMHKREPQKELFGGEVAIRRGGGLVLRVSENNDQIRIFFHPHLPRISFPVLHPPCTTSPDVHTPCYSIFVVYLMSSDSVFCKFV